MSVIIPGTSKIVEFIILFAISAAAAALLIAFLFRRIRRYGDYAYTNARVGAMKGDLFRKEELDPLVQSRNLQNLLSMLEDSPYSPYLRDIEEPDPQNVEPSMNHHLADSYSKIYSIAPEEIKEIFQEMEKIIEIKNIKTILTGKYAEIPPEEIEERLFPRRFLPEEVYERALDAEDIDEAATAFEETEYWDPINKALTELEETGKLLPVWFNLEKKYWSEIWYKIRVSSSKSANVIQKAIGTEIDLKNMLTALRCKAEKVDPEEIDKYIIPIHLELESQTLDRAIESEDVEEALAVLEDSAYGEIISEARTEYEETGSVFAIERAMKEFLLRKLRTLSIQHSTGAGPLIAFFHEKKTEVKNLTGIVNGKAEDLEPEEIREKLVAPEVER